MLNSHVEARKPADLFVNDGVQGFALRSTDQFDVYKLGSIYVVRTGPDVFKALRESATGAYVSPGTRLIDGAEVLSIMSWGVEVQYGNDVIEQSFKDAGLRLI